MFLAGHPWHSIPSKWLKQIYGRLVIFNINSKPVILSVLGSNKVDIEKSRIFSHHLLFRDLLLLCLKSNFSLNLIFNSFNNFLAQPRSNFVYQINAVRHWRVQTSLASTIKFLHSFVQLLETDFWWSYWLEYIWVIWIHVFGKNIYRFSNFLINQIAQNCFIDLLFLTRGQLAPWSSL